MACAAAEGSIGTVSDAAGAAEPLGESAILVVVAPPGAGASVGTLGSGAAGAGAVAGAGVAAAGCEPVAAGAGAAAEGVAAAGAC